MISEKMQTALNEQINSELYSSYLYLSMQSYFASVNLAGFANWMGIQVLEELCHVNKLFDFVNERGGRVLLDSIEKPPREWDSALGVFEATLQHERKVSGLINELVDMAIEEKDHATNSFLHWFVDEQVEEENTADSVLGQLKLIKNEPQGLFIMDNQMGQRVFTPPAAEGETK